ncbi:MAG: hypothetical protein JNM18_24355 [Planctomycetaceae bacterium]|nr:hypothetical protein [Planctomycetaceae bacterium]
MLRREFLLLSTLAAASGCSNIDLSRAMGPSEKQFNLITPGMSEKKVVEILGEPSKRMAVQGGEGGLDRLVIYRWISSSKIITVTFDATGTAIGKQKI